MLSLSSSPSEPGAIAVTCRISDTPFKQALARFRPGDTAEVGGPLGTFLLATDRPRCSWPGVLQLPRFAGLSGSPRIPKPVSHSRCSIRPGRPRSSCSGAELGRTGEGLEPIRPALHDHSPRRLDYSWGGRVAGSWRRVGRAARRLRARPRVYVAGLPDMVSEMVTMLTERFGVPPDYIDYEVFRGF